MSERVTVLVHRTCGHIAGLMNSEVLRAGLERSHRMLQASGYHQWRHLPDRPRTTGMNPSTKEHGNVNQGRC